MKYISLCFLFVFSLILVFEVSAQNKESNSSENRVKPEELNILIGSWSGALTYIDYSSGKPFTMPADLIIEKGKSDNQLILSNIYPNEPKANGKDKINISKNGKQINKKDIISKQKFPNGQTKISTEFESKDNNKPAVIRNIYILDSETFIIRKEVKFKDSEKWLKRSEFSYNRKK